LKAPNTVLVPHIGFETAEAMSAKADIALQQLKDFLSDGQPMGNGGSRDHAVAMKALRQS
jgi:lactate dehydrogenase-like 2-hydroxyacid dehydrogenase